MIRLTLFILFLQVLNFIVASDNPNFLFHAPDTITKIIEGNIPVTTGAVDFAVGDRVFKTSYRIVGDLKACQKRPLVILHGGPGYNYTYMKPHDILYKNAGIPAVYYNQIGLRDYPDAPAEFWTIDLYNDELENVVKKLGIEADFDLLGHSWGGVIGSDYAARRVHPGLQHLILANTFSSSKLYLSGVEYWIDQLPPDLRDIMKHQDDYTLEEVAEASQYYYDHHICSLDPWPQDLIASISHGSGNYHPEFTTRERLKDWNVITDLHKISCPTLLISSPNDEMWEPAVRPFFSNIPQCKWVAMKNATHVPMYEYPQRYFRALVTFLSDA